MEERTRPMPRWLETFIAIGGCVSVLLLLAMVGCNSERDMLPLRTASAAGNSQGLAERVRKLEDKFAEFEKHFGVEQVGTVTLTIPAGQASVGTTVKLERPQPKHAIVLTGESGSGGSHVFTKAERITSTQFDITVCIFNAKPVTTPYNCRIGYAVFRGEGKPETSKKTPQVKPQEVEAPPAMPNRPAITPQPVQGPPVKQPPPQPTALTWIEYRNDCGLDSQRENEARTEQVFREKYKGKLIRWSGTVRGIQEKMLASGYFISVQMQPSDGIHSDLSLSVGKELAKTALSLKDGDTVTFDGYLSSQGGVITSHIIDVVKVTKQ